MAHNDDGGNDDDEQYGYGMFVYHSFYNEYK